MITVFISLVFLTLGSLNFKGFLGITKVSSIDEPDLESVDTTYFRFLQKSIVSKKFKVA